MSRRALPLCAALALASCGGPAGGEVGLDIRHDAVSGVATYELRIFSANALPCSTILASPDTYRIDDKRCSDANRETAKDCFIFHTNITPGSGATTTRIDSIPPGSRSVFAVGDDAGATPIGKACQTVSITDGEVAKVTLTLQAY